MGPSNPKRNWFLTYPQNDATMEKLLSELSDIAPISEYVIAQETHEDGNKHLHAYIKFQGDGIKLSQAPTVFNVLEKTGNYQPCRSCKDVIKYCTKEEVYISNFDIKQYLEKKGKLTVSTIRSKSAKQALIDGDINIHAIRNYNLARSILVDPYEHHDVRGLWIYGPPGTGKSHSVRECFPNAYIKAQSKWWDGYEGQKYVIMDDFDFPPLAHLLKIWADKYSCSGQTKGGNAELTHTHFIITSNYSIEDLFRKHKDTDDEVLIEAITRRFRVVHKTSRDVSILVPRDSPVERHWLGGVPLTGAPLTRTEQLIIEYNKTRKRKLT